MGFRKVLSVVMMLFLMTGFNCPLVTFSAEKATSVEKKMPRYRPPLRGAPTRRVGGGSRGPGDETPLIATLTPDDMGLTASAMPVLYWFLSSPWKGPIMFSIVEFETMETVIETEIKVEKSGILALPLEDFKVALTQDVEYEWYVGLVPDMKNRSLDIISTGTIKRIPSPDDLKAKLSASPDRPHFVYAEEGLWYDAIEAVSELIDKTPTDKTLRQERISLLEQVELNDVVAFEKQLLAK